MMTLIEIFLAFTIATHLMALHCVKKRIDFNSHKQEYLRSAMVTGLCWPVTFVPILIMFVRLER